MTGSVCLEPARVLVVAKAPVPGRVKTRLGADIGMQAAADFAAAALLDTVSTATSVFNDCHIALAGDLTDAVRHVEITQALDGWVVHQQRGDDFGTRLANAHQDAAAGGRMVVQIGMDTPQVSLDHLASVATSSDPAVLGPAPDGGWWVLGLRHPEAAEALRWVEMSTAQTFDQTRRALVECGIEVTVGEPLRDLDTARDVLEVVADLHTSADEKEFVRTWRQIMEKGERG